MRCLTNQLASARRRCTRPVECQVRVQIFDCRITLRQPTKVAGQQREGFHHTIPICDLSLKRFWIVPKNPNCPTFELLFVLRKSEIVGELVSQAIDFSQLFPYFVFSHSLRYEATQQSDFSFEQETDL